ncbi:MAG: aminopeptidase [Clostridia bacterium]|nr:aminopeptidase [Clostridia bacterium]
MKKNEKDEKKSGIEELRKKLLYKQKNGFETEIDAKAVAEYCEGYKAFLDASKTEREAVKTAVALAEKAGFVPFSLGRKPVKGKGYYAVNRNKSLVLFILGSEPLENGIYISAAHVDSPRLDIKQRPLYETDGMSFLKTHYYGGIKKYHWVATPLALHGIVVRADGTSVDVCIGEDDADPVFYINDLLPHLGRDQMKRAASDVISGEQLNILMGTEPVKGEGSDLIKLNVLKLLNEKYGITEADFLSAELCCVPAFKAKDVGLDRSLIGGYGHDDRVCAYPALTAILKEKKPKHTLMVVLADKEEIGSEGTTGMKSRFTFDIISDLCAAFKANENVVRENSKCISADVGAAFDPNFPEVYDRRNNCFLNHGVVVMKFTGAGGKGGSNDAGAEFCGFVRSAFDCGGVLWQTSELGKVDGGGGGTVAKFFAEKGIDVIDVGVPVLSMHSPYEVVSKIDVYMMERASTAFFAS